MLHCFLLHGFNQHHLTAPRDSVHANGMACYWKRPDDPIQVASERHTSSGLWPRASRPPGLDEPNPIEQLFALQPPTSIFKEAQATANTHTDTHTRPIFLCPCIERWASAKRVHERWAWEYAEFMTAEECVCATRSICSTFTTPVVPQRLFVDQYWSFDFYLKLIETKVK